MTDTDSVDLLVIGAGMAGLTAAGYVASRGGTAFVVEKGRDIGGSAAVSGGKLWTAPSFEALRKEDPEGDEVLAAGVVGDFPSVVDWVRSIGIDVSDEIVIAGWGLGHDFDVLGYLDRCRRLVEQAGGWVVRQTSVKELRTDATGVIGARIVDRDGESDIEARFTMLATGGFQASPDLRAQYIDPQARTMPLRSNVFSTGDGLRLGTEVGGAQRADTTGFYGHLVCAPLKELLPKDFARLAQYYSASCLLFNLDGQRFCDETLGDHHTTQALVKQPDMRGLLVADHDAYLTRATVAPSTNMEALDKFAEAESEGANTACVETIDDIEAAAGKWGFAGADIVSGVKRYETWCDDPSSSLDPPRSRGPRALPRPPYHIIEVSPAISFTYGGLRIDDHGRVLDEADEPIPGLLAAGADGCAFVHGYCGGLAMSAVFALRGAHTALGDS
jgi:succinate dehydrogenase/fumarate reductase flavoprotein subunit